MSNINLNCISSTVDPIWKIFVKESVNEPEKIINKHHSQLNFNGNEAKVAYEQIINTNYKSEIINNSTSVKKTNLTARQIQLKKNNNDNSIDHVKVDANIILKSVEYGDLEFLKQHITDKNVNIVDQYGWTALMSAAYCGNKSIVQFLLQLGAKKHYKDKSGLTALQLAQKKNHLHIINILKTSKKSFKVQEKGEIKDLKIIKQFHCSICQATFKETTIEKHETSTLHIFNKNPKLPDPIYGISKQNKGYQIMLNNGWQEKNGLGPYGCGQKYPVKTILKRDRKGLGQLPKPISRITHFKNNDTNAIAHIKQPMIVKTQLPQRKKDREKILSKERIKERAIRRALS